MNLGFELRRLAEVALLALVLSAILRQGALAQSLVMLPCRVLVPTDWQAAGAEGDLRLFKHRSGKLEMSVVCLDLGAKDFPLMRLGPHAVSSVSSKAGPGKIQSFIYLGEWESLSITIFDSGESKYSSKVASAALQSIFRGIESSP